MTQNAPELDYTRLSFPTDALTLKAIRAVLPELFAQETPAFLDGSDITVAGLLSVERALAHKAFAVTLGLDDPNPHENRNDLIEMMAEEYQRFGLASGLVHTQQLARDIEKQAIDQAKTLLGQGR
jgi:hypothetical protein